MKLYGALRRHWNNRKYGASTHAKEFLCMFSQFGHVLSSNIASFRRLKKLKKNRCLERRQLINPAERPCVSDRPCVHSVPDILKTVLLLHIVHL
jgi:hypothetical protein